MRQLVENVGPAWSSGRHAMWTRMTGSRSGTVTVGSRPLAWVCTSNTEVGVSHADTSGVLVSYAVATVRTSAPHGGYRLAWLCPCCGRRVGRLYLLENRDRLACRSCCQLAYCSQYPHAGCHPRVVAPEFTCTMTEAGWVAGRGRFEVTRQVRTFTGRPFA